MNDVRNGAGEKSVEKPERTEPKGDGRGRALGRHARRHLRSVIDHLWGPTGSVILHVLILFALIHLVAIESRDAQTEVEVMVVDPERIDLEDFERELDMLPDIDVEVLPPEMEIMLEAPPEVQRHDPTPTDDLAALDIRTDVQSPLVMRGLFSGRTASGRSAMLRQHGGRHAGATAAASLRALEWLRDQQLPDGSWQGEGIARAKTAMTGLALLTFLAYGQTPNSEVFGATVERGIRFLVEQDQKEDGTFNHTEGAAASRGGVYSHGIAAYALSEAYALTRIPAVKVAMERAVGVIVRGQRPDGGFDYQFSRTGGHRDRCTSVAAWMAQAIKAAYIAGAEVPGLEEAMVRAAEGFKLSFHAPSGYFLYASYESTPNRGPSPSHGQTAPGVLSLQLLGQAQSVEVQQGMRTLSAWRPDWSSPPGFTEPLYLWYYATQAFFHTGGALWERWNDAFAATVVQNQNADGSWTWTRGRSEAYGPVYATTFSALSLMVYYRYLPTYQPIAVEPTPTQESEDDVVIEIL